MTRHPLLSLSLVLLTLGVSAVARSSPPGTLPVQGFVTDVDGRVIDGAVDLELALYDRLDATTPVFVEEFVDHELQAGFFTVLLGTANPVDVATIAGAEELWLEISVDGDVLERVEIGSVPYALEATRIGGMAAEEPQPTLGCARRGPPCAAGTPRPTSRSARPWSVRPICPTRSI